VRILIDSFPKGHLGPILCMCMTNHALDQFLNEILKHRDSGLHRELNVVRLGGRSKDPNMIPLSIFNHRKSFNDQRTPSERAINDEYFDLLRGPSDAVVESSDLEAVLREMNPGLLEQIRSVHQGFVIAGWERQGVKLAQMSPMRFWIEGHDRETGTARERESSQRRTMIAEYEAEALRRLHAKYERVHRSYRQVSHARDLRILRNADIIGVTTSKAAEMHEVISKLAPKIILCEEAGEIMEPQLLAALGSSTTEHLILIGDHEQLRPKPKKYDLTRASGRGFDLDVSTFERLIEERTCSFMTLSVQRRMRPEIADLVRCSLYPHLEDHPRVREYKNIQGVKGNVFFMDHSFPEASATDGTALETSHGNRTEAAFAARLAKYLVLQGYATADQLVILTPYLGQLRLVREELAKIRLDKVVLGEKDEEDLAEVDQSPKGAPSASVKQTALGDCLRIATVDNFQGEEADVVILSTVRNNSQRKVGFLSESNRVNVALSRARKGLYILGNAALLSTSPSSCKMWRDVLSLMQSRDQVKSDGIPLVCSLHPDRETLVKAPDDFDRCIDGGCSLPCETRLNCGHQCPRRCHPDDRGHLTIKCTKPCTRRCPEGLHPCKKLCFQSCEGCDVLVENRALPSEVMCSVKCAFQFSPCGHPCSSMSHAICESAERSNRVHVRCPLKCQRRRECEHDCPLGCSHEGPCPPCEQPCGRRCEHSKCGKKCREPCAPCVESHCANRCGHSRCSQLCSAPCDRAMCNVKCAKKLPCGHPCPSLCCEPCVVPLTACLVCAKNRDHIVDMVGFTSFKDYCTIPERERSPLIQLGCGHLYTVEYLDAKMGISKFFDGSETMAITVQHLQEANFLKCDQCRMVDDRVLRYKRITKLAELNKLSMNFHRDIAAKLASLTDRTLKAFDLRKAARTVSREVNPDAVDIAKEVDDLLRDLRDPLTLAFQSSLIVGVDTTWKDRLGAIAEILKLNPVADEVRRFAEPAQVALNVAGASERLFVSKMELVLGLLNVFNEPAIAMEIFRLIRTAKLVTDDARGFQSKVRVVEDQRGAEEALSVMLKSFGDHRGWNGQGHAMRCPNGHVYFIGECGGAMQVGRCPDCGEAVGGANHQLLPSNQPATVGRASVIERGN
jgi:hypothetical protein